MKRFIILLLLVFSIYSHAQNVGVGTITPDPSALLHIDLGASISKGFLVTGQNNNSATIPDLGGSSRMFFYPGKSAFRAGLVSGTQWNNVNVGISSAAFGSGTIASGNTSFAAGIATTASGVNSTSFGNSTNATGDYSFASGISTNASGQASTASGYNTTAKAVFGSAFGVSNDNTDNPGTLGVGTDRIFQIGNGDAFTHSNAMTVLRNGNIGIGTLLPAALLNVNTGSSTTMGFLVDGSNNLSGTIPDLGGSSRMCFYPGKSAFRAGLVSGTQWNNANVGMSSAAFGSGTIASGNTSFAAGIGTTASGVNSTSFGNSTNATGDYSFVSGISTNASGQATTASGYNTSAKAVFATAIGVSNDNTDNPATTAAATDRLFQIGNGDAFTHSNALTVLRSGNMGLGILNPSNKLHIFNGASGGIPFSPVFTPLVVEGSGHTYINLLSPDANETAILFGRASNAANGVIMYNNSSNVNSFQFRTNGNVTRMILYDNGNAWLQGTLTQASDARLKKDIQPLQNSLAKITSLNGYTYHWKNEDIDPALQTGVLAQEVQKIFPSLVKQDSKGMLAVNYSGLIPVLIESIKEQQMQIDELKKLVEKLLDDKH